MKMINSFDPSAAAAGSFKHQVANPCGGVYLFNESNQWIQLTLPDGGNVGLPAWWARFYYLADVQGPVVWQVLATIVTVATPLSQVYGESYERNEAAGRNFYDGPIPRNPYIANSVVSTVSTTSVENTGNPAGTNVLSATVAGSSGLNASILNDGTFSFAQYIASVYDTLLALFPGASPVLQLGKNVKIQGKDSNGIAGNIFGVDGSGNTFLQAHSTNNHVQILDKNGNILLNVSGQNTTIAGGDATSVQGNIFGVDGSGSTFLQAHPTNNQVVVYDKNGVKFAAFDPANHGFQLPGPSAGTPLLVLYTNPGGGNLYIQGIDNTHKIYIKSANGNNLVSIDPSGNIRAAGSITPNVVP